MAGPAMPTPTPAQPLQGCRNCGAQLRSKPVYERGRMRLRALYLLLAVFTLGILAVVLWPVWPRKRVQTGVILTCTACGLQQT